MFRTSNWYAVSSRYGGGVTIVSAARTAGMDAMGHTTTNWLLLLLLDTVTRFPVELHSVTCTP